MVGIVDEDLYCSAVRKCITIVVGQEGQEIGEPEKSKIKSQEASL